MASIMHGIKPLKWLPIEGPCLSFWQQTTRCFQYLNTNRDTNIPDSADYVVIGSGISGALTAFELIESGVDAKKIVILEAREAASGASSRNAGHVRPDAFRGFQVYSKIHGPEQALKIIANERAVLHRIDHFVKKHDVSCDFNLTTTFDVCLTQDFADFNARSLQEYQNAGGDVSHVKYYSGAEAQSKTRVNGVVAAYEWPAGSSHPAKLAQWLLSRAIEAGAGLFTHCPALSITEASSSSAETPLWEISTPRGAIRTSTVIHCSNAFAPHLVPALMPFMTPMRAQAHALIPPPSFAGDNMLPSTFSLRRALHHFFSVAQRPADGIIILGASRASPNISAEARESRYTIDDSFFNEEVRDDALREFESCFRESGWQNLRYGEGLLHVWSGIIGLTEDSVPFIGRVPGKNGQWLCAGFGGHGMARIFNCAPGVVMMIRGGQWKDTGLPECFEVTEERLERLDKGVKESVF